MALRTKRILRKYVPSVYSRVRVTEGSDSDATMRGGARSSSFSWLRRTFSNGSTHVPLSESPKRELRMRSVAKPGRQNSHSKKHRKILPGLCGDGSL